MTVDWRGKTGSFPAIFLIFNVRYATIVPMKTIFTRLPKSQAKITIAIPAAMVQKHVDDCVDLHAKDIEIKGFRRGKAPKPMIIEKIGIGRIHQETLDRALSAGYAHAIKEHGFHPISKPSVALKKFTLLPSGVVSDTLEYDLTVDLMPDIKLGDYTKIRITDTKLIKPDTNVTDAEVEKVLAHLQQQKSTMDDANAPVAPGHWVEISFDGKINGVSQEKLNSSHHPLVVGSGAMVPGFEDALVGMKKDEKKDIHITFPKDYFAKDIVGKNADFSVTVHEIKNIVLPVLDAAFAKEYGHDTLDALKKAIGNQLTTEKKQRADQLLEAAILEKGRKLLTVTIPDGLVRQETDRIIERMKESVEKQGVVFDRYLESIKKTHDDLHKEYEPQARANIEVGLFLGEVMKKEKLDPDDKESMRKVMDSLIARAIKQVKSL